MKLSVVIPVYNEKNTIREILKKVKQVNIDGVEKEIIIVDDCSKDGTRDILKTLQTEQPDLKIYFKEINSGKGATLREGFKYTTGDYVIVQDADLEYNPEDYKVLLDALQKNNAKVVYGSRFSGKYEHMTNMHFIGNKMLTFLTNILFGVTLDDMETCYKLVKSDLVKSLDLKERRFGFEPEVTAKISRIHNVRIYEVGISYYGRTYAEGKKINWKDGFRAIYCILKYNLF